MQAEIESVLPDALVVDRTAHMSTARANNDAQMFENMTLIFPVLAYAVAALIVMTTLSRMIDNQRMQMGTAHALGFSAHQLKCTISPTPSRLPAGRRRAGHAHRPQHAALSAVGYADCAERNALSAHAADFRLQRGA